MTQSDRGSILLRAFIGALVLTVQLACFPTLLAQSQETGEVRLEWFNSLEEAKVESERTGKPILMEIHGRPWCQPCVAQGENIIGKPEFIEWVHDKFVLLEIQVGKGYSSDQGNPVWKEQFEKHRLPGIPATVFLDEDLEAFGIVYPKPDVSQWLGAAANIWTVRAFQEQRASSEPTAILNFRMTESNNISVPAILNDAIALNLMFHTAEDSVFLTQATTTQYPEIVLDQQGASESWGGRSEIRFGKARLAIGSLAAEQVTIFEDMHSGKNTDGKFGPKQLHTRVIELDFEASQMRLWQQVPSEVTANATDWNSLELHRDSGMMFVSGKLFSNEAEASAKFMIHSGYSGFGLLCRQAVKDIPFLGTLPIEKESSVLDSAGNKLVTKQISVPKFQFGPVNLPAVPFSMFDGAIRQQEFNILGMDFLQRFHWCFDLEADRVYFLPINDLNEEQR